MRFVGRDRELKKLNELYQEEEFQLLLSMEDGGLEKRC